MGKSNVGLLQNETVFTILENSLGLSVAMSASSSASSSQSPSLW